MRDSASSSAMVKDGPATSQERGSFLFSRLDPAWRIAAGRIISKFNGRLRDKGGSSCLPVGTESLCAVPYLE